MIPDLRERVAGESPCRIFVNLPWSCRKGRLSCVKRFEWQIFFDLQLRWYRVDTPLDF